MSGSVLHKIRPRLKRVEFREKSTTRGTLFKQSPVKEKPSPSRAPPKRSDPVEVESIWQDEFDEPLLQHKGKSQNDYLREFAPIIDNILCITLQMEAPANEGICLSCNTRQTAWRCSDCIGCDHFCNECVRVHHHSLPYHRVDHWTGSFFEPAWLCQAGVVIHLGHRGLPCPNNVRSQADGVDGSDSDNSPPPSSDNDNVFGNGLPKLKGNDYHVVVDKSGVHRIRIIPCACANASKDNGYIHYLQMGLFPASLQDIKTVFTFGVLNDFRLDNLECKTAALNYWQKIVRLTSNEFPKSVPDRYRELLRSSRLWRNIKYRKWNGFGHGDLRKPGPGSLAIFCAACPQPGINLPAEWNKDPMQWKFMRGFMFDGNFTAEQLKMKNPDDDVHLTDGDAFFTTRKPYYDHLKVALEIREQRTCNDYTAIHKANMLKQHLLHTGIGAAACPRHGCFIPHSVVDFQKGERQMNIDFCLSEALKYNMEGIRQVLLSYDLMCQFWKNVEKRFQGNPHLTFPQAVEILRAIGLFHVHGHEDHCYARYAPTFIPGAGMVDGEVLETLWAALNKISDSSRSQSTAHRRETIDDHMNDSNWKKLVSLINRLCGRFLKAGKSAKISEQAFDALSSTADQDLVQAWKEQEEAALMGRNSRPESMDIYDIKIHKGPSKDEMQLRLIHDESANSSTKGGATMIGQGLKIEDSQVFLATVLRRLGRNATVKERLDIAERQQRLQSRIDNFHIGAAQLWPVDDEDLWLEGRIGEPLDILPTDSEEEEESLPHHPIGREGPEKALLLLPSNIGLDKCIALGYQSFVQQEKALRVGQMNDSLHGLRLAISRKAVVFREGLRSSRSKNRKTRSWDEILQVDGSVRHHARMYCRARIAFKRLGADELEMARFRPLTRTQLSVTTARIDPALRGQRDSSLAWFWSMDVQADVQAAQGMTEFYRVHWLKAKSRRDRWREEKILLGSEMQWTELFFRYRATCWKTFAAESSAIIASRDAHSHDSETTAESEFRHSKGHVCYALKLESMWNRLAQQAVLQFGAAKAAPRLGLRPFTKSRSSSSSSSNLSP